MKLRCLIIFVILLSFLSCKDKTFYDRHRKIWEKVIDKTDMFENGNFQSLIGTGHGYYHKEYGILYRSVEEYDIRPRLINDKIIDMEFYNYGDEIHVNATVYPNIFHCHTSKYNLIYEIQHDDIVFFELKESLQYGSYGISSICLNPPHLIKNVIVSPLSVKYLQTNKLKNDGHLFFVRFMNENTYKDYVFLGDYRLSEILKTCSEKIRGTIEPNLVWSGNDSSWQTIH